MIELRTLGDAVIRVGEKEVRPNAPMLFAALLYLCVERGRRVPRAALQELLFPETDERSGAHSLRQLLYKLRHLGVPYETSTNDVLLTTSDVVIDTDAAFDGPATAPGDTVIGVLPGFHGPPTPRFRAWLDNYRSTAETALRTRLLKQLADFRDRADHAGTHRVASAIRQFDPFNEEAALALAEVLALTGNKVDAIKVLEDYSAALGPGTEALRLAPASLKRRIAEVTGASDQQVTPLFGRGEVLSVLSQHFARSCGGRPSVTFIWGDAGVGKTRVLQEYAKQVHIRRARALWARCQEHDLTRPLGAFVDLMPKLLALPGALGIAPDSMESLRRLGNTPQDTRTSDATSAVIVATQIREALQDLLCSVASEHPLVLFVEDAQWLDDVSLQLLLGFNADQARVHIALTHRGRPQLANRRLSESVFVHQLEPLPQDDAARLMEHLLSSRPADTGVLEQCLALAAGNPLFLHTLAEHLRWGGATPPSSSRISDLLRQRTKVLDARSLLLLRCVAVLGKQCTLARLSSVGGLDGDTLLLALQDLGDRSMLSRMDGAFACCHELLEHAVLSDAPETLLCTLYERTALLLESEGDAHRDASLLWSCAEAWRRAGNKSRATTAFSRCATFALEVGQPTFAGTAIEQALETCGEPERLSLLREAVTAALQADQPNLVIHNIHRYHASLRASGQDVPGHDDLELVEINQVRRSGRSTWDLRHQLRKCATAPNASLEHRLDAARLYLYAAEQHLATSDGIALYEALASYREPKDSAIEQQLHLDMTFHCCFGNIAKAGQIARELVAIRRDTNASSAIGLLGNVGIVLFRAGLIDEALAVLHAFEEICRRLGLVEMSANHSAYLSTIYLAVGDEDKGLYWHERADAICRDHVVANPFYHFSNRIELALRRREADAAREDLALAVASFHDIDAPYPSRAHHAYKVLLLHLDNRLSDQTVDLATMRQLDDRGRNYAEHDLFAHAMFLALESCGFREEANSRLQAYVGRWRRELHPLPQYLANLTSTSGLARFAKAAPVVHNI